LPIIKQEHQRKRTVRWTILVVFVTFFLAVAFAFITSYLLQNMQSLFLSLLLLLVIIIIGIIFDVLGTAVTAANERPFHAKASKKVYGAKRGIYLVRNADHVANFCSDIVGDIFGIISGITAAIIVVHIVLNYPDLNEMMTSILLIGLVSALTVGGKALGKTIAIRKPTEIVHFIARLWTTFDRIFSFKKNKKQKKH
jgi:CBS domain containing-hemolysin-like protein